MDKLPSQPILGLIHGMEVLQLLAAQGVEISGVEISKTLGIEKTKVSRILKTLTYLGFAQATSGRKYVLGPAIHVLSAQLLHSSKLIKHSLKYLIQLTELNVVVAMGVLWRDKVAYTYHWVPGIMPADGLGRVDLFPATQSSIGLKLLSQKSDNEIEAIINFSKPIPGFRSEKEFMITINNIRDQGFGYTIFKNHASLAINVGEPAKAAIALAHINESIPLEEYVTILQDKIALIEHDMIKHKSVV